MATDDAPELIEREGYLEARLKGQYSLNRLKKGASAAIAACQTLGFTGLLLDVSAIIGFEHAGTTDRFEMGTHGAQLAGGKIAIAVFGAEAQADPERFGVRVAQNRGARVDIFTEREQAIAWLTGTGPG
jgi:hypothetical protein